MPKIFITNKCVGKEQKQNVIRYMLTVICRSEDPDSEIRAYRD